jgi:hypothetical protein
MRRSCHYAIILFRILQRTNTEPMRVNLDLMDLSEQQQPPASRIASKIGSSSSASGSPARGRHNPFLSSPKPPKRSGSKNSLNNNAQLPLLLPPPPVPPAKLKLQSETSPRSGSSRSSNSSNSNNNDLIQW